MAQEKVKVVIEVRGGVVEAVYAGDFVEVLVVDWDNIAKADGGFPEVQEPEAWGAMSRSTAAIAKVAFGSAP